MSGSKIVMIVSGFPRRSETFALNEVRALDEQGMLAAIFATKPGDGFSLHPDCQEILNRVQYLSPGSPVEQAAAVIERLGGRVVTGIHGYFAHTPAEVASHVAHRLGVPYGFSVHARDARKVPVSDLAERARKAVCVVACNTDVARDFHHSGANVNVIPHGVDIKRFYSSPLPSNNLIRLLAVGRLVGKKGFDVLIKAVSRLSFSFHLRIIGEGPEWERLTNDISDANLSDCVELCGGMTHAELPQEYANSDIVVVPSVMDKSGDRDGLPNVVLEAMSCGRPVVASNVGAIQSAVVGERTGMILPPGNSKELVKALEYLADKRTDRVKFGHNARKRIEKDFELRYCTERFCKFLQTVYI